MRKIISVLIVSLIVQAGAWSQNMTLQQAISVARANSVQALEARQEFISVYWAWRAYQASRLPSLHLYGNLGNFNRSLTLLQSPDDGTMRYVSSFNMQNGMGLQARQNIPFTGGTLTVYTDLNRIDQFGTDARVTWYSQPVTISYQQPLFAYNQFKWDKLIEPKAYETGRKKYVAAYKKQFQKIASLVENYRTTSGRMNGRDLVYKQVMELSSTVGKDRMSMRALERSVNVALDNAMSLYRDEYPGMGQDHYDLICYFMAGFPASLIELLTGISKNTLYSKKSRLLDELAASHSPHKDLFYRAIK